ncbi:MULTISPECIES: hypothetical protein [Rhizobium]|uniref:Uncharacterized protein n=1 Tax=Rhizobium esperanzae TaxID=1967781 RepID=A0A7W6UL46_9HYPH|nr:MULTISPECIES: hypothetical protein [Rhizobium]MBB4440204.1 hypothetical protein [Rhizobium esperanzae]MDH6202232.1 hypothetical protein [Rhizobium leguminosarum]
MKPEGFQTYAGSVEDQSLVGFAGLLPRIGTHPGDVKMLIVKR